MIAEHWLYEIEKLEYKIETIKNDIDMLNSIATSISSCIYGDKVQTSHKRDKIGDMVSKIMDKEQEMQDTIDRYIELKENIQKTISKLDVKLYQIIYKKYFEYKRNKEIAIEMKITPMHVYRLHKKAIEEIQKMLDDVIK